MGVTRTVGLKNLMRQLSTLEENISDADTDALYIKSVKNLAARLLALVKKATPVGEYSDVVAFTTRDGKDVLFKINKVKMGGTLRRGWDVNDNAGVLKAGNEYSITIRNDAPYAAYVELGHVVKNKEGKQVGYVEGQYFLKKSEDTLDKWADAELEKQMTTWLEGILNDK